ncbi:hypothetical protein GHT06_007883 [Daphnia sinensis]|uniref:Uncharacterized protein n=1 Tax=Daphnia sinensis TaxID=1820382 RepID=A0AAD5LK09_9CRUS|nr:hypothetical protein GHT06_007883 [Daphnia sinensis]
MDTFLNCYIALASHVRRTVPISSSAYIIAATTPKGNDEKPKGSDGKKGQRKRWVFSLAQQTKREKKLTNGNSEKSNIAMKKQRTRATSSMTSRSISYELVSPSGCSFRGLVGTHARTSSELLYYFIGETRVRHQQLRSNGAALYIYGGTIGPEYCMRSLCCCVQR